MNIGLFVAFAVFGQASGYYAIFNASQENAVHILAVGGEYLLQSFARNIVFP